MQEAGTGEDFQRPKHLRMPDEECIERGGPQDKIVSIHGGELAV
jgi:hypothetical protein